MLIDGNGGEGPASGQVERAETSAADGTGRLRLSDVSVTQVGVTCEVRVTLTIGEASFTGSVSSVAVQTARQRAIARATVDALNELLADEVRLELVSLDELSVSDAPARIVSTLLLVTPSDTEMLVGAAPEGDRPELAVARATLAAANRRLAPGTI